MAKYFRHGFFFRLEKQVEARFSSIQKSKVLHKSVHVNNFGVMKTGFIM